jgi:probable phosphoglycerate mutase
MPTEWNAAGRLQGREDLPLAVEMAPDWLVPAELNGFRWMTSPLRRAVGTAHRLGIDAPVIEPRLAEMGWGAWEGETLAALRGRLGAEMATAEAAGLDFRAPGGESPREVQARVIPLLAEIACSAHPTAAVTHKGVIRAVLALATGWDMREKPPYRLSWSSAHLFRLDEAGQPAVMRLNLPLERV